MEPATIDWGSHTHGEWSWVSKGDHWAIGSGFGHRVKGRQIFRCVTRMLAPHKGLYFPSLSFQKLEPKPPLQKLAIYRERHSNRSQPGLQSESRSQNKTSNFSFIKELCLSRGKHKMSLKHCLGRLHGAIFKGSGRTPKGFLFFC